MSTAITVVGLGQMGRAIASTLAAAGFETTVWNRTARSDVVGADVHVAATLGEAITASPTIVVCVADSSAVEDVVTGVHGPVDLAGRDIVDFTTGLPDDAVRLSSVVEDAGGHYLSGIIASFPEGIGEPDTQLVVGGDERVWHRNRRAVEVLGGASWWSGRSVREPAVLDIAVALNFYHVALAGFLTSARYAANNDIPTQHLMRLVEPAVPTLQAHIASALAEMERGDFRTDQATIDVHLAAIETSVDAMGAHGNFLVPLIDFFHRAQAEGDGSLSFAAFTNHIA